MPDYSKCVIYTIRTGEGLYVGSTCNFVNRKRQHKQNINNESSKLYKTIRENGGVWDMQPHSEYPCASKIQMNIEEEKVRIELKADLNSQCCYRFDRKEYRLNNKDKHREYMKEYSLKNKDKKQESDKEYRLNNKDKIAEYKKAYCLKNKDKIAEQKKAYRLKKKNKQDIKI